jgi:hypothetical protein
MHGARLERVQAKIALVRNWAQPVIKGFERSSNVARRSGGLQLEDLLLFVGLCCDSGMPTT